MSSDNSTSPNPQSNDTGRGRRGSVSAAAFTNLFQRRNSASSGTPVFPSAIATAALNDQRRRLSISTLGLNGSVPTPTGALAQRRVSQSTNNSDSIDENAVDDDDGPADSRVPTTPFGRRMSFGSQAMRSGRPGGPSPGTGNGTQPSRSPGSLLDQVPEAGTTASAVPPLSVGTDSSGRSRALSNLSSTARSDQGMSWSEQLRSRAESTLSAGVRPSFSGVTNSPPRPGLAQVSGDRSQSIAEMPAPPTQAHKPRSPPRDARPKPDAFQERILKGDFYMD